MMAKPSWWPPRRDRIAAEIALLLPRRVIYWALVRAFAEAAKRQGSGHASSAGLDYDDAMFKDVVRSWRFREYNLPPNQVGRAAW
jgi:hypothetical protein